MTLQSRRKAAEREPFKPVCKIGGVMRIPGFRIRWYRGSQTAPEAWATSHMHNATVFSPGTSLVLLTVVSAAGLALGHLRLRGVGLGSARVMFVGLVAGSLGFGIDHTVLEFLREFGLMLFVFTMCLQLGPGFFASLR